MRPLLAQKVGKRFEKRLYPIEVQGGLAPNQDGEVHSASHLRVDETLPIVDIFRLAGQVLVRGEEEASLAAQVARVGHIVNRTANIEIADLLVALVPGVVEQGTNRDHRAVPAARPLRLSCPIARLGETGVAHKLSPLA